MRQVQRNHYPEHIIYLLYSLLGNVYITDTFNCRVRKVTVSTGIITTIAGSSTSGSFSGDNGLATSAGLNLPSGIALDSSGRFISPFYWDIALLTPSTLGNVYFADLYNHCIRKVTVSTGIITTITGTGTSSYSGDNGAATAAELNNPAGVALDSSGNHHYIALIQRIFHYTIPGNVYIADHSNNCIRKVTAVSTNSPR